LGRAAITAGKKVRFFQADQLIEALYRGLAENTVGKLIEHLLRHDLVVIDDLGFTALDRVAADHLFRFISAAYEQRSVAITTNVEFERWTQFLPDAASATAILDRFLHHCHVIALDEPSWGCWRLLALETRRKLCLSIMELGSRGAGAIRVRRRRRR